jgi:hypothetical protein
MTEILVRQLVLLFGGMSMVAVGLVGVTGTVDVRVLLAVLILVAVSVVSFTFGKESGHLVRA